MNALRYRPRLLEIEAIKLSDGRYLLLTEEPCYMDGEEFEASYELIRERRAGGGGGPDSAASPQRWRWSRPEETVGLPRVRGRNAGRREMQRVRQVHAVRQGGGRGGMIS